jgi:hypothetical protein
MKNTGKVPHLIATQCKQRIIFITELDYIFIKLILKIENLIQVNMSRKYRALLPGQLPYRPQSLAHVLIQTR